MPNWLRVLTVCIILCFTVTEKPQLLDATERGLRRLEFELRKLSIALDRLDTELNKFEVTAIQLHQEFEEGAEARERDHAERMRKMTELHEQRMKELGELLRMVESQP